MRNISDVVLAQQTSQPAIILGSAPSVRILNKQHFAGLKIGLGDMPWRAPELGPYDFWITANTYYPLPWNKKHLKDIQKSGSRLLLSSVCISNYSKVAGEIIQDLESNKNFESLVFFDHQHIHPHELGLSNSSCCSFKSQLVKDDSIQFQLGSLIGSKDAAYGIGSTVALHGFAFAILMKSNPIYIAGVELPSDQSAYKAYKNFKRPDEKLLSKCWRLCKQQLRIGNQEIPDWPSNIREQILRDFQSIANIAHALGIEVYCLSETSPLSTLNHIKFGRLPMLPTL